MRYSLTIALLLLIGACSERSAPEIQSQKVRPAKLLTVGLENNQTRYRFTARLEAKQTIDLSFEVSGPLENAAIKQGEVISKGTLVASLEATDFLLAVREAEVQLKLAAQDLNRKKKVLLEQGIAKSQVEDAQTTYELQQVRLQAARERLADSRIYAPFDAYVSRQYFDSAVNVAAGVPIVKLHDLNQLLVMVSIPQNLVATIGQEQLNRTWVEFSFAPGRQFDITYFENSGEADSLAQTYEVAFIMDSPEGLNLLPGMTAVATVELKMAEDAHILLPSSALVPTTDGKLSVWVFDPATQQVERRIITTATPLQQGVPVTSGLQDGEQVVIAGAGQLQAGMKVRPL